MGDEGVTTITTMTPSTTGGSRRRRGGNHHAKENALTRTVQKGQMGGTRRRRRGKKGGDASNWVLDNFGSGETQFQNTFGPSSTSQGSILPTIVGAPAVLANNIPQGSPQQQSGGRRRKKGGYWSSVIQQALVPFSLLGLQHAFSKRKRSSGGSHTRRSRK